MSKIHPIQLFKIPKPITPEVMNEAYSLGMIRKRDLLDQRSCKGSCRNATEAVWHADKEKFTYDRTKFRSTFKEDINHINIT